MGQVAYAASKAAVASITQTLGPELALSRSTAREAGTQGRGDARVKMEDAAEHLPPPPQLDEPVLLGSFGGQSLFHQGDFLCESPLAVVQPQAAPPLYFLTRDPLPADLTIS